MVQVIPHDWNDGLTRGVADEAVVNNRTYDSLRSELAKRGMSTTGNKVSVGNDECC